MTKMLPSREDPFSYESSFWVDVRKNRERRATPARIKAALEGKVGHRKRGRGDERETWYIGQILHYGLGSAKTTKAAARQRLVEAAKAGKLKVPEPILDIEKRLKEDYQERSGKEQRSRVKQKKHARIAIDRTKSMNTGYSDEGIKSQETEGWEGFRTGAMKMDQPHMFTLPRTEGRLAVDDSSWHKEYEAEIQAKVKRRQEKYKVDRTRPLMDQCS